MSADEMVIRMVNAPHERREKMQAKSRAAKRERQQKARKKSRRAGMINAMLWLALKIELVILGLASIFLVFAH